MSQRHMHSGRIFVIGASAGGVRALQLLASHLPADFPAPILVVQHVGDYPTILPQLLTRSGALPASHPPDGAPIERGRIYVAPPGFHMVVEGDRIRIVRGPREHHARPAIDPLFRSVAISCGPAVVGVVLTGGLDDGTAGLQAIKRAGGIAVVQDPQDAEAPSMPLSALRYVEVDHRVPLAGMGQLLVSLATSPARTVAVEKPALEIHENKITIGQGDFMEHLTAIGKPSTFVCPECEGTLWEIAETDPPRFRCHTGHAYTMRTLYKAQAEGTDEALWSALRALQEKELLLQSMARGYRNEDDADEAARLEQEAQEIAGHAQELRRLMETIPAPPE